MFFSELSTDAADGGDTETTKTTIDDLYDSDEDAANEAWIGRRRRRYSFGNNDNNANQSSGSASADKLPPTDAVLSCPACMIVVTRDCQRLVWIIS